MQDLYLPITERREDQYIGKACDEGSLPFSGTTFSLSNSFGKPGEETLFGSCKGGRHKTGMQWLFASYLANVCCFSIVIITVYIVFSIVRCELVEVSLNIILELCLYILYLNIPYATGMKLYHETSTTTKLGTGGPPNILVVP